MRPKIFKAFGKNVKAMRLRKKLSQAKLAKASGMHINYIGRIERGEQNISLENIEKLARGLKVKPGDLFRGIR